MSERGKKYPTATVDKGDAGMEKAIGYMLGAILSALFVILLVDYIRVAPSF